MPKTTRSSGANQNDASKNETMMPRRLQGIVLLLRLLIVEEHQKAVVLLLLLEGEEVLRLALLIMLRGGEILLLMGFQLPSGTPIQTSTISPIGMQLGLLLGV
jgi:hypothetical protein